MPRSTTEQHQGIAHLLCQATTEILWPSVRELVPGHPRPPALSTRVGHGRATYCRIDSRGPQILINYGIGMVAGKLSSGAECANWKTAEEIAARGYFGGKVTPLHLFAHTVLHECSHALDFLNRGGDRQSGRRHHDAAFYAALDQLHDTKPAAEVLGFLEARFEREGYANQFDDGCSELAESARDLARQFQPGQRVVFESRPGEKVTGEVVRVNRRSVTVRVISGSKILLARVPSTMLR